MPSGRYLDTFTIPPILPIPTYPHATTKKTPYLRRGQHLDKALAAGPHAGAHGVGARQVAVEAGAVELREDVHLGASAGPGTQGCVFVPGAWMCAHSIAVYLSSSQAAPSIHPTAQPHALTKRQPTTGAKLAPSRDALRPPAASDHGHILVHVRTHAAAAARTLLMPLLMQLDMGTSTRR